MGKWYCKETKRYEVLINLGIPKCYTGEYDEHIANKDIKFPSAGPRSTFKVSILTYNSYRIACHLDPSDVQVKVSLIEQLPSHERIDWNREINITNYYLGIGCWQTFLSGDRNQSIYTPNRGGARPGYEYPVADLSSR